MSVHEIEMAPSSRDVRALGTVVGVWAHPDDEAYLSAGLMGAAVDAGSRVVCVTATRGELGTSDPERWPPEVLAGVREDELHASLATVGVDEHVWLPFRDGACDRADAADATRLIQRVLDDADADTVVTFGPDGMTGHPDHIAVGRWATAAAARARRRPRVLYATKTAAWRAKHADLHQRIPIFGPDGPPAAEPRDVAFHVALEGEALDRKIAALLAHQSQTADLVLAMGASRYRTWAAEEYFSAPRRVGT